MSPHTHEQPRNQPASGPERPPDDISLPSFRQRTPAAPSPLRTLDPTKPLPSSLYIHIPFCAHKCHYCDFYSIVDKQDRQPAFTDRLTRELEALAPLAGPLQTIFIGGGTPTLLETRHWARLLDTLHARFDLSRRPEFTVECNPESATPELFALLASGGVNRISMGAQSFNPAHLRTLERLHNPENVRKALGLAAEAGIDRRSIDLIFGIPGQTLADWQADLDTALALGTEHLSCYDLTYEPNTALTARLERGDVTPIDEDIELEMFTFTRDHLRAHGLHPYEVSNFARPGAECRHNLAYWRQEQWLAAGPSASGHVAGHRFKNIPRLDDYLAADDGGFPTVLDHEPPDARRALAERLMTTLRLAEGVDVPAVRAQAGAIDSALFARIAEAAENAQREGRLTMDSDRWILTDAGVLFADRVASDFIALVL